MVTFTGSTQTGKHLAVEAAKSLKKFTLEMGGKSPLIVLADADVDYAVRAAAFGIFFHQGQVCMANSRVLVEEPIFDTFCERFVAVAQRLKVGDPREPDTIIGPLIRGTQCAVIDGHVEDAVAKGATVLVRRQAREAVLLADRAQRRDARHAHLPRRELRPSDLDHQGQGP